MSVYQYWSSLKKLSVCRLKTVKIVPKKLSECRLKTGVGISKIACVASEKV